MFTIRNARGGDSPRIQSMVHAAHINPTGLDWRRFVVAVDTEDRVIGCCQIKPHRDGSRELASLVVDPNYRSQGIARALMEHLTGLYEGPLYLMCRASLGGFYERFGFQAITDPAEMTHFFRRISRLAGLAKFLMGKGETLLIMRRSVSTSTRQISGDTDVTMEGHPDVSAEPAPSHTPPGR